MIQNKCSHYLLSLNCNGTGQYATIKRLLSDPVFTGVNYIWLKSLYCTIHHWLCRQIG